MHKLVAFGSLALLCAGVAFFIYDADAKSLRADDPQSVANGREIYAQHCAGCHGENLEGQPQWRVRLPNGRLPAPPHDASGHTWHHADELLFSIVKIGTEGIVGGNYQSDMLAFGDILSDEEIIDVLSFIKSTWPPNIKKQHDGVNERNRLYGN